MKGAYILIPLLCTLCTGCDSEDESLMSTREIGFSTTVASSEAEPGTRAEATTDNLTEMGVFAYFTSTGNFSNGSSTPNHLYNQSVKKAGGIWTYSPIRYWPANANEKVSFFAYAPHTAAVSGNANDKIRIAKPTAFNAPGRPVISYSAPKGELDLLLSTGVTDCTNTHDPVQFTMKHAMTKVVFKVQLNDGDSKTITGISTECASSADFSINDANTAVTAENIGTSKSTCTATVSITADGTVKTVKEFFLIPSHPNDTKVTLTYTDSDGSHTIEGALPNVTPNDWLSGKAIGYTLKIQDNRITAITTNTDMAWETQQTPSPTHAFYNYIIATAEDLANFRDDVNNGNRNARALQIADIDMQDLATSPTHGEDATNWTPIGHGTRYFQGSYNGNGHTISNLKLQWHAKYTQEAGMGLFGGILNANLIGIHLRNTEIALQAPSSGTGTLVGYMRENSKVISCSATGKIKTVILGEISGGMPYSTGGLIGYANCNAGLSWVVLCNAKVDIGENGSVIPNTGLCSVGGLIGYAYNVDVASCYASGNIEIKDIPTKNMYIIYVGGFCGSSTEGCIVGSYSLGDIAVSLPNRGSVDDIIYAGGFLGNINSGSLLSCYSYATLALAYPNIASQSQTGQICFGGFIGYWTENGTMFFCYGDGTSIPSSHDFSSRIFSEEFIGYGKIDEYCFSSSTLMGQTVQDIVAPGSPIESIVDYPFIKYDFSINSYWTDYRFYSKKWDSEYFWKPTPDEQGHPRISYEIEDPTLP